MFTRQSARSTFAAGVCAPSTTTPAFETCAPGHNVANRCDCVIMLNLRIHQLWLSEQSLMLIRVVGSMYYLQSDFSIGVTIEVVCRFRRTTPITGVVVMYASTLYNLIGWVSDWLLVY